MSHGVEIEPQRPVMSDNFPWLEHPIFVITHHILLKAMTTSFRNTDIDTDVHVSPSMTSFGGQKNSSYMGNRTKDALYFSVTIFPPKVTTFEHSMVKPQTCEVACSSFKLILTKGSH